MALFETLSPLYKRALKLQLGHQGIVAFCHGGGEEGGGILGVDEDLVTDGDGMNLGGGVIGGDVVLIHEWDQEGSGRRRRVARWGERRGPLCQSQRGRGEWQGQCRKPYA